MALFSLLYNLYLLRLSYQEDFIGQVASMAPLATGLLALPTGILSDRLGRKPFLIASGLLLAISQLGLCLTTSPGALLTFSFVGGVAMAFVWVNHVPFLSDNAHPARRAEALAIWSALQIIVRMLLSLIGGFMPGVMGYFLGLSTEVPEPFRYALFFGAACSLIAVVPLFYASGPSRREKAPAPTRRRPELTKAQKSPDEVEPIAPPWRVFAAITALSGTRGFSMGLTYPFFNVFFEAELGVGPAAIGAIFFLSQLAGLPATFAAPTLVRRFGPTLTILPARTLGGSALGIMGAFISLPLAIPMFPTRAHRRSHRQPIRPALLHPSAAPALLGADPRSPRLRLPASELPRQPHRRHTHPRLWLRGRLWFGLRVADCEWPNHGGFLWTATSAFSYRRALRPISRVGTSRTTTKFLLTQTLGSGSG